MKTASIVIPCFNEEETLPEFYRRIAEMSATVSDTEFDFIFVNDCSSDSTGSILQELSKRDPRVRVLELAANSGHQRAVTAGLDFSRGESVIIIDADLQDPPELIPEMIQLVQSGFDVVHAQRKHREGESVFKLGTARLFYVALGKLSTTRIVENCGDFRAISSRVAATIQTFREPHRFLRGLFSLVGFNQCILRFNRHQRFAGTTKYSLRKMVRLASDALFSFSTAPIRAILWLAASLWMLSLVYLALTLFQWAAGRTVEGWTSIVILLTVFTGIILAAIAVVGSYVGRIFQQGQDRPLYWISRSHNVAFPKDAAANARPEIRLAVQMAEISSEAASVQRIDRVRAASAFGSPMPVFDEGNVLSKLRTLAPALHTDEAKQ